MADQIQHSEAIKELVQCGNNPIYFIRKYVKIQHMVRGLINFDLYPYQEQAILNFLKNDRVIVNKARQLGFSTVVAAFIAWLIMFHENKSVLIIATKADVAKNLIVKVKTILNNLPSWMWLAEYDINRVHMIGLTNGSWVKAISKTKDAGRSEALSLLVIDEAAHIDRMAEMWKSAGATLATGGKAIALSTPNGMEDNNWFYKFCKEAQEEINGWKYQVVHWWENPDYAKDLIDDSRVPGGKTSSWFRDFTRDMTEQEIHQELLTDFLYSGNTFFEPGIIAFYQKAVVEPIEKTFIDRCLWIWKHPEPDKKYIVTADTAMGTSEDYSAAHVMDLDTMEIVAEYKGKIAPDIFAFLLIEHIAKVYNNAYIVVETTGVGSATATTIKVLDYENLAYFSKENGRLINSWLAQSRDIAPGVIVDAKIRPIMISKVEEFLRKKMVDIHSSRTVHEMKSFVVKNGKAQASKGNNDDLIMSLALAIWVRDLCPEFNSTNFNHTNDITKMYEAVSVIKTTTTIGTENYADRERERIRKIVENQATVRIGTRTVQIPWIYRM